MQPAGFPCTSGASFVPPMEDVFMLALYVPVYAVPSWISSICGASPPVFVMLRILLICRHIDCGMFFAKRSNSVHRLLVPSQPN